MHPKIVFHQPDAAPNNNWLRRAVNAIVFERRIPYRLDQGINRLFKALGIRFKTVRIEGLNVTVRRLTQDEEFVANVLVGDDYIREGFDINVSDVVIDIGGNIGTFSLRAARAAKDGRVLCFEPNSENYSLLRKNISRNGFENIMPFQMAIAGQPGTVRLFAGGDTGLHSTSASRGVDESAFEDVPCITLEQVFEENQIRKCNYLKIDCEGAEYEILYNTPCDVLSRVDKIVMEYHSTGHEEKRAQGDELVRFLQGHGFCIVDYIDFADFDCGFIRANRSG